jgi:hypothetical protein
MNTEEIDPIVRAVLYEGYLLYPYRASALKNKQRWNFGAIEPLNEASLMRTQCILVAKLDSSLEVKVRFLQLITRQVGKMIDPAAGVDGAHELVQTLETPDQCYQQWEEAEERELCLQPTLLSALLERPAFVSFETNPEIWRDPIIDSFQNVTGVLLRSQSELRATLEISAESLAEHVFKIAIDVRNTTPLSAGLSDQEKLKRTLLSTHTLLHTVDGEFVSLLDPPEEMKMFTSRCVNQGTWPVLAGTSPRRDLMLSSPIILYDYPEVAPESAGDLFDGTEIDEILMLRIMTMTEDEKRQMRGLDDHARRILDRTEATSNDHFMRLHGVLRKSVDTKSGEKSICVSGIECRPGDRVRLRPLNGADIFDLALKGRTARIQSIEQDFDGKCHVAVVLEDDPGRDLGEQKFPGHRFFFTPEELEPLTDAS